MNKKILAPLCSAVVLLALTTSPLAAQGAHSTLAGFEATTDYQLLIEGKVDEKAKLRISRTAAAVLITSENLDGPLLIWGGRSKRVDQVLASDLLERSNDAVDLSEGVTRKYLGDFTNEEQVFVLPVPGKNVRMRPTPPLLGFTSRTGLLEHSPGYKTGMSQYEPSTAILAKLSDLEDVEIKVFFGSWCHVCKEYLPLFLKVHEAIEDSGVQVTYYGLAPAGWQEPEVQKAEVVGLPTAVVYRDGKEVGRFSGATKFTRPEAALYEALQ